MTGVLFDDFGVDLSALGVFLSVGVATEVPLLRPVNRELAGTVSEGRCGFAFFGGGGGPFDGLSPAC